MLQAISFRFEKGVWFVQPVVILYIAFHIQVSVEIISYYAVLATSESAKEHSMLRTYLKGKEREFRGVESPNGRVNNDGMSIAWNKLTCDTNNVLKYQSSSIRTTLLRQLGEGGQYVVHCPMERSRIIFGFKFDSIT